MKSIKKFVVVSIALIVNLTASAIILQNQIISDSESKTLLKEELPFDQITDTPYYHMSDAIDKNLDRNGHITILK